ncbi:MAG TPA: hypothetical protein VEA19_02825, partial [Actinomycetota bacterium]|nr:hypothetical protein [Actinomycetota bacterium]
LAISAVMTPIARKYYERVRAAVTIRRGESYLTSDEELADILASGRPWVIAAIGFGGLTAILYLMIFKPF